MAMETMILVSIPERVWGGLERLFCGVLGAGTIVSIPERVWGGLEQTCHAVIDAPGGVSIPERVWGGLEPTWGPTLKRSIRAFQSLRGFGVGWSLILRPQCNQGNACFNP